MSNMRTAALVVGALLGVTACSTEGAPVALTEPAIVAASPTFELSDEERARIRAEVGIPPDPDPITQEVYIGDLNEIDLDIVHGDAEKAVTRGLNQCLSIKQSSDHDRELHIKSTDLRFTSPDHPYGHGLTTAGRILEAVHLNLCPDYPLPKK